MKRIRKILVGLIAMVLLVGASMSAFAAEGDGVATTITAVSSVKDSSGKSNITIYTNDKSKETEITVKCATKGAGNVASTLKVTPSNRGVVNVDKTVIKPEPATQAGKNKFACEAKFKLKAVGNGKATVTVTFTDPISKKSKSKKLTVTVKTWADEIGFTDNSPVVKNEDGDYEITLASVKGSKLNLGAIVKTANVSNAKLKYSVADKNNKTIACDAKGNVSIKNNAVVPGQIKIESADRKVNNAVTFVNVKTDVSPVKTIAIAPDVPKTNKGTTAAKLGYGKVSANGKKLFLKGNKGSDNNTYQLNCVVDAKASMSDLAFASNKPAIATVDSKGKITAVGNGTATITVTSKLGNNAKKATLSVTVDTDVEYVNVASTRFTIQANNKDTARINATTNTNAKTKNVTYRISSIKVGESTYEAALNNKNKWVWPSGFKAANYITVDSKGNVKAKQACVATIVAAAKNNADACATVTVTAEDSVQSLVLKVSNDDYNADDVKPTFNSKTGAFTKATAYRTEEGNNSGKLSLNAEATLVSKKVDQDPVVTWTSNKTSVATVDKDGNVNLVGNGTAKITATAKSGKSASANITVKTDAYKITSPVKVEVEGEDKVIYVKGGFSGKKTMASIINAAVNSDASKKNITYSPKDITAAQLTEAGVQVQVSAKEIDNTRKPISVSYKIMPSGSDIETDYTIVSNGETVTKLEMKVGDKLTLKAMKDNAVLTDAKWGSTDTKSVAVDKNGVVTAKAEATAPAKIKVGDDEVIEVVVGKKDATVQTEINKSFKTKLNEENRDYTGVSAKFNEKTRNVQMSILNPTQDISDLKDTGLVAAMEDIANNSYMNKLVIDEALITDSTGTYTVRAIGDSPATAEVELVDNKGNTKQVGSLTEAVAAVLTNHGSRVQDLNGESYDIALNLHYYGAPSLTYALAYTADVSMSAANYDKLIDSKITKAVANFTKQLESGVNFNGETVDSDIVGVKYNEAANEFDVVVEDLDVALEKFTEYSKEYANKSFDELWAEAEQQKDNLSTNIVIGDEQKTDAKDIAGDLSSVTLAFTSANGQRAVDSLSRKELENGYGDSDASSKKAFVKEVLSYYFDQLKAAEPPYDDLDGVAGNLGNLVGSVSSANATFTVGKQTYVQSYKVNFLVSDNAYDKAADKRINDKVEENKGDLAKNGFIVAYDDSNKLTVHIQKHENDILDWDKALDQPLVMTWDMLNEDKIIGKLNEVLGTMVGYEENVSKANVVVNGKTTVLVDGGKRVSGEGEITTEEADDLLNALVDVKSKKTEATTLRDMHGRTATLKATYHIDQINRDITLIYTIEFSVEGAGEQPSAQSSISENSTLSVVDDDLIDENEDDGTTEDETDGTTEDEADGTAEDETDGTTEDETDGTTKDETDGTTEDETDGVTEDETDGTDEGETSGTTEDESASESDSVTEDVPVETTEESIDTVNVVEE